MTIYLIVIVLTAIIGEAGSMKRGSYIRENGREVFIGSKGAAFLILMIWCAVFSFRAISVGTDASGYYRTFMTVWNNDLSLDEFSSYQRDWLFNYLEYFCARLSKGNWFIFQAVVSVLIYLPIIHISRKYSDDMGAVLLLFIFTIRFFSGFNGMRQAIAMSILAYAYYEFYLEREYIQFSIVSLIAFGFHSSVLLALPFLLISTQPLKSRMVRWSALALVLLYVFVWKIWPSIIRFFILIGQTKMASDYAEVALDNGSGLLRFIVAILPFVLGCIFKKTLDNEYGQVDCELILCLYAGLFSLLSMRYWIFARVGAYFGIGQIMFIPKLKTIVASKTGGRALILILYFAYMIAMLLHGEGHYYPYSFFGN